ncbi:MAG: nucleotidyltransferase family protein [Candidatus Omnitrophica bacterium]|nr:nucleotidyltransferase family protein [Candidatus Omnitrophota bacterium]
MISCILLSAGLSSRFGSPKALATIGSLTVIEKLQQMLLKTSISEIIIVLGSEPEKIIPFIGKDKRISYVINKDFLKGQTSSFKAGVKRSDINSRGYLLLPVDFPLVKTQTIQNLIDIFLEKKPRMLIPLYLGRKGHPPLFSAELRKHFLNLSDENGLNTLAKEDKSGEVSFIDTDDQGVIKSFNSPEEFEALKKLIR